MSYLVLARKSRPQTFDQMVGQRPVVRTLQNSIKRDRIAHAILFSGVRGVGKTTLARLMAKAINCTAALDARPCDRCESCNEIRNGSSIDLYEIDGASNRGIQEIRELKEKIRFLPTRARFKVFIIDEVHMLTTEAFNALLKTLEEPPAHVHFMFATTEIHKIPITIRSRCQQYELQRIPASELQEHLRKLTEAEGYGIEDQALALLVREADGSVRDGLSLLDQMFSYGEKEITAAEVTEMLGLVNHGLLLDFVTALLNRDRAGVFAALAIVFQSGLDLRRFLQEVLAQFRALLFCTLEGCKEILNLTDEDLTTLDTLAAAHSSETIHLQLCMLMETAEKLQTSTQPRVLLETSMLKIIEAGNVVPVTRILEKLEDLTQGFADNRTTPEKGLARDGGLKKKPETKPLAEKTEGAEKPAVAPEDFRTLEAAEKKPAAARKVSKTTAPPERQEEGPQNPLSEPIPLPPEPGANAIDPAPPILLNPHEKDVRKNWPEFIDYVKKESLWMAQDLQRAESALEEPSGELHLHYLDNANCALLRQKENIQELTKLALNFFQKPLTIRFTAPRDEENSTAKGEDSPNQKRQQLANDQMVIMAAEIFNGQIGDIRIGSKSRK